MEHAIFVENLRKTFENREVVKGTAFSVRPGEIFGFLGPNGAGKTTSIKMMIGELPADAGTIRILDMDMPGQRDSIKKIMGVVPDHQNLYDRLTVRQNLDLFTRLHEEPPSRIDELLEMVDLQEHADVPTNKLSRGLRQRTLIARGLIHRPKVFFLDEPTSALDPHSAIGIRTVIETLRDRGTTVFITTHYMEEANQLCDRIAIMNKGSIVAIDTPEALKLKFGQKKVKLTLAGLNGGPTEELDLPMDFSAGEKITACLKEGRIIKMHSQEATLEEVFLNLTGDPWQIQEKSDASAES